MASDRKKFLKDLGSGLLLTAYPGLSQSQNRSYEMDQETVIHPRDATDEKQWARFAKKYYDTSRSFTNLENGYFGVQPKPVFKNFQENLFLVNTELSRFARKEYPELFARIRKELASFLNVSDEEILLTRNATEALNIAIQGYPFKPGDEVILSQLDYPSMIETFQLLEKRGKISIRRIELPLLPKTDEEIVQVYQNAITPKTKLILLTQVSNVTGLIIPVKKIAALAKEKNIDTIVDSAHALGQIPFDLPGMQADFVGMNLHKWIGNPIGAGVLYIKKSRIKEMQPFWGDVKNAETDMAKLGHYGTTQFAVMMTIPASLSFHRQLGTEKIASRLHYLKSIWVHAFRDHRKVEVLTPEDPGLSCAIASFRVRGRTAPEVAGYLMEQHQVFTVSREVGNDTCVRVTPALYNSEADIRKLIAALHML